MKRMLVRLVLACVLPAATTVTADDTEAYIPGGWREGVYLNVVMDIGDTERDGVLCTFGIDCGPPFTSEAAHSHLAAMYAPGESVTAPGMFRAVLAAVIERRELDELHLSLMISNQHDNVPVGEQSARGGGTLLAGYQPLWQRRGDVVRVLESLPHLAAPVTHRLQPKETYFEWLRYIRGGDVALGQNTVGNFGVVDPVPDYDPTIIRDGRYQAPIDDVYACPELFSLLFTQGDSARDEDLDTEIEEQLSLPAQSSFVEFLGYLHRSNTDLLPQLDTTVPLKKTWLISSREQASSLGKQAAAGGGTVLLVDDPVQLQADLVGALAGLVNPRSSLRNPVFVEDTINRGQLLQDVFVPMFSASPRVGWMGNLKKLKLDARRSDSGASADAAAELYQLVDVHGRQAMEMSGDDKGSLRTDALTFWTDASSLPAGDGRNVSDEADGRVVARGGAGQKIDGYVNYRDGHGGFVHYFIGDTNSDAATDGYPARQVFYESKEGRAFAPLNADTVTADDLKPLLDADGNLGEENLFDLIRWARGQDRDNAGGTARNWLLGELLHSRPLALNYGATPGYSVSNPNIHLFFGSGEGAFHIVENTDSQGNQSGREVFAFYPRETMATVHWLHDAATSSPARQYGVDGSPVVLKQDRNGDGTIDYSAGDKAIVYFGMRRGGTSYFALDVSNPDASPRLLWKISPTRGGAFDELGLTFSTPLVGKVDFNGVPRDVLVFGGGYNGGWNEDFTARLGKDLGASDDAIGNAIYIVDALTGELVWKAVAGQTGASSNTQYAHAGLVDSIPSEVSALVTPAGILHRLYVGDTGGAVWRIDLPPAESDDPNHRRNHWFITKLADFGFDAAEPGGAENRDRRFFHAPDIVQSSDDTGKFDGVIIQSGNRADPNETVVENALFYIKDRHIESGAVLVQAENEAAHPTGRYQEADLGDQTDCLVTTTGENTGTGNGLCSHKPLSNGWVVHFPEAGEKGLSSPVTDAGRVFATTFVPAAVTSCPVRQGQGRLYVLRLADASTVANGQRVYELGEGIPDGAEHIGELIYIPGGGVDLYDLDGDGTRDAANLLPSEAARMYRVYWREPGIDAL